MGGYNILCKPVNRAYDMQPNAFNHPLSRRQVLKTAGAGFGYLALAGLLGAQQRQAAPGPLAPRRPHFPVKAKRIIFCFMEGAMSQMDTFEYKPYLQRNDQRIAPGGAVLTASKFRFARHGQTGAWVSNLMPNMARHVDKFCFIRGLHTDTPATRRRSSSSTPARRLPS